MTFPRALTRRVLPPLVLALALAATGCQAPRTALRVGPGVAVPGGAALTARLGSPAPFGLRYLSTTDWEVASATLTQGATPIAELDVEATRGADGTRSATFTFTDVLPGAGYDLAVRLMRRDGTGALVQVGNTTLAAFTLAPGSNELTLPAPSFFSDGGPTPGEPTGYVDAYVASWPAAGPGARVAEPRDAVEAADGTVYVADAGNHRVVRIDGDGELTVLAGSADGEAGFVDGDGPDARFSSPQGLLLASDGDLYVADAGNHAIRRIDLHAPYAVDTFAGDGPGFADGPADTAKFQDPAGLAEGANGAIYVADAGNHRIRRIQGGADAVVAVDTLAGEGTAAFTNGAPPNAQFSSPTGVAVGPNVVYVADSGNHAIRAVRLDPTSQEPDSVMTVAGTGVPGFADEIGAAAKFDGPTDVAVKDGRVLVADAGNRRIRRIDSPLVGAVVSTEAGDGELGQDDGAGDEPRFVEPFGLSFLDATGRLLVADRVGARVRAMAAGLVSGVAGDGTPGDLLGATDGAARPQPRRVAFEPDGDAVVTDATANRLWHVTAAGVVTAFSGTGVYGDTPGAPDVARYRGPAGIVRRPDGKFYVADPGNHAIHLLDADGTARVYAGTLVEGDADGDAAAAGFRQPFGLALAADGTLYVSELCGRIRAIAPALGTAGPVVTTLAGADAPGYAEGTGDDARFDAPAGLALLPDGDLLIADAANHRVRRLREGDGGWTASTLLGDGVAGWTDVPPYRMSSPTDVVVDADGAIWVVDAVKRRLRRVVLTDEGITSAHAVGSGLDGYLDGPASKARFGGPTGLALGPDGTLFVADPEQGGLRTIRY